MKKFLNSVLASTAFNIIVLPYLIRNTIITYRHYSYEKDKLVNAINSNDDFFEFLQQLGFKRSRFGTTLTTVNRYSDEEGYEELIENSRRNMQKFMLAFFESEDLLAIVNLSTAVNTRKNLIVSILKPASYDVFYRNAIELSISIVLWLSVAFALFYFNIF